MSLRKPALRSQLILFSELLAEKVESGPHEARFFLYLAQTLNLGLYKCLYMGTPPYNRPTLIAVIFYSMYHGYYESQNIVKYAGDSIGAQWILNGMRMPSDKTVERTIDKLLKELDSVFIQTLRLCDEWGLIGGVRGYTDGVKVQANASKHKAMSYEYLGKKIARGKEDLKALFDALREVISEWELTGDDFNDIALKDSEEAHKGLRKLHQESLSKRQEEIFNRDIGGTEGQSRSEAEKTKEEIRMAEIKGGLQILDSIEPEKRDEAFETLNNIGFVNKRVSRMEEAKAELEAKWKAANGNKPIPGTQQINFTDSESCIMQTKHHGVQQCYNNFAIADDKANIILGTYTSNNPVDQVSLIPCIERVEQTYGSLAGYQLGADAGFFSAHNILNTRAHGIEFYASFPEAKWPYAKDKFKYNEIADEYTCPGGCTLPAVKRSRDGSTCEYSNGTACSSCKHQKDCTKAKDGVRRINRDMEGDKLREEGREMASSELGMAIIKARKGIIEPVWGNIKTQDDFTQLHYRGIDKASLEWELHCLLQNMKKLLKVYLKTKSFQDIVHENCGICCKVA